MAVFLVIVFVTCMFCKHIIEVINNIEEDMYEYCQTEKWLDVIRIIFKHRLRFQSEFQNCKSKYANFLVIAWNLFYHRRLIAKQETESMPNLSIFFLHLIRVCCTRVSSLYRYITHTIAITLYVEVKFIEYTLEIGMESCSFLFSSSFISKSINLIKKSSYGHV